LRGSLWNFARQPGLQNPYSWPFVDQLSALGVIEIHGHAADQVLAGTRSAGSVLHMPLMCAWLVGIFAGCNPTKKNAPRGVRVP